MSDVESLPADLSFQVAACYCVHDDHWFLHNSIRQCGRYVPVVVFVSRLAWNGSTGDWERAAEAAESAGAEVVIGEWPGESEHRGFALAEMKRRGHGHILIPDGDEIPDDKLINALLRIAAADASDLVRVQMDTYWKSPRYLIRPREQIAPALMLDCRTSRHLHIREYTGERPLVLTPEHGILHHLSYAGPDSRILRKISTWGHRDEVRRGWFAQKWLAWDRNRNLGDLHPTHPHCYSYAQRISVPPELQDCWDERPHPAEPDRGHLWPAVSIVIPLYGGSDDISACLVGVRNCQDLIGQTIVVDDDSPDDAADVARSFAASIENLTVLENETNLGFAAACNRGFKGSSGDVVIFLNSDAILTRSGLIRLVQSLRASGAIGASGPMTNNAGYYQRTACPIENLSHLEEFAIDFAHSGEPDRDVEILVGFCLAVRRDVVEELGGLPFDERFGRGLRRSRFLSGCRRYPSRSFRARAQAHVEGLGVKSPAFGEHGAGFDFGG
jgi:hypothetical protein